LNRIITICVGLLSVALLSTAAAGAADRPESAKDTAAKQCAAEKKADKRAFKATYGKHAMRTCRKGAKAEAREDSAEFKNAAKECKAERDGDPEGFRETYGTKNGKNALGKCVSSKVKKAEEGEEAPTA